MKPSISQIRTQINYQFSNQSLDQVLRQALYQVTTQVSNQVRNQVDQIWIRTQDQVNYLMIPDELENAVDQAVYKALS